MPTRDIDGRGNTPKEAVQDMWRRVIPLREDGYHAISSVEIVDSKTNKIVETFELTDPEWAYAEGGGGGAGPSGSTKKTTEKNHRPPRPHDYAFRARVRLQQ